MQVGTECYGNKEEGHPATQDRLEKEVCAQEGFLEEMSLDLGLQAQVHTNHKVKGVECLEPLAVGTACAKTWKREYRCSGNRYGLVWLICGVGRRSTKLKGEAKS